MVCFQELVGVVADLMWDKDTGSLHVLAACNLPARIPLTSGLTAVGADPEHLIMTRGPEMLAWAQQITQGQGHALLPWQAPDAASFQLCIEPAEEDELRDSKMELLVASALGTTHALTATSSQVRLAASHVTPQMAAVFTITNILFLWLHLLKIGKLCFIRSSVCCHPWLPQKLLS